jgi:hypothetical protein
MQAMTSANSCGFSHPQPSAIIDTETNRLLDARL